MGKSLRFELSRHAVGGLWTIVVLRTDGVEVWAGSGYVSRATARLAAWRAAWTYRKALAGFAG